MFDALGGLSGYDVSDGTITIDGSGMNNLGADATSIYSYYLQLNAKLHARDLDIALGNMSRSFFLAIVVLYLLMSGLFRSFIDSALVVAALPLATVGGVALLRIMDLPMDLLTMIGFITLLGLVVNNAILLVHQTRTAEREGLVRRDAVEQAVRRRLRPILMSTMTSLFGMLPLLLIPGPGSEVYQGLAAVIVGGMSVSTVFTLIFLPSLLRLGETHPASERASDAAVSPSPVSP